MQSKSVVAKRTEERLLAREIELQEANAILEAAKLALEGKIPELEKEVFESRDKLKTVEQVNFCSCLSFAFLPLYPFMELFRLTSRAYEVCSDNVSS